jgi:hypothetical protein
LNELSLTDEDTQSKIDERDLRWSVVVPNEIRARRGLPGLDGGDEPVGVMEQAKLQADVSIQNAELTAETAKTTAAMKPAVGPAGTQAKAQANATRTRDANRSAASPDSSGEARQPKGEGRVQG